MKSAILFLYIGLYFVGCSQPNKVETAKNKKDIAKINIEKEVIKNMDDPKSYEFVEIDSLKNITKVDSLFKRTEKLMRYANSDQELGSGYKDIYKRQLLLLARGGSVDLKEHKELKVKYEHIDESVEKYYAQIDGIQKVLDDSIKRNTLLKDIIGYNTTYKYRGKNKFGALVLETKEVELDKNLKVVSIK